MTKEEVQLLIALCLKWNPSQFDGKLFHLKPELESGNEFIRITDSRLLVVQNERTVDLPDDPDSGIVIGARREIVDVMLYRPEWMQRNYYEPLQFLSMLA